MPICNCFHVKQANIGKITSLNLRGFVKSTFDVKNFIQSLLNLSRAISLQFTFELCVAAKIAENSRKPTFRGLKNRSNLSTLIKLKSA